MPFKHEVPGSNPDGSNMRGHSSSGRAQGLIKTLSSRFNYLNLGEFGDTIRDTPKTKTSHRTFKVLKTNRSITNRNSRPPT